MAPSKVPMVTQESINHMASTITISTPNMATQIEDEPSPWYLFNSIIDTDTGGILQCKHLMQTKEKDTGDLWQNGLSK